MFFNRLRFRADEFQSHTCTKPYSLAAIKKDMTILPDDIKNKIEQLFLSSLDREKVTELLKSLWTASLNVGADQLARSILTLSNGQLLEIESIFLTHFFGDPRDIIMQAENKIGNPGHYFIQPFTDKNLNEPPDYLDGAKVIKWAWAEQQPFGYVGNNNDQARKEIFGLAICQYEENDSVYRFSCDINWDTIQDASYDTADNAIEQLPDQYKNVAANWKTK